MKKRPINKFVVTIILALLVPILTYTIYQFLQVDENEELIRSIYERQLDSIIFSVNQHCFDRLASWQSEMASSAVQDYKTFLQLNHKPKIQELVDQQEVITAAFLRFSEDYFDFAYDDRFQAMNPSRQELKDKVNELVADNSELLKRYIEYLRMGYIRPFAKSWSSNQFEFTLLIFPILNETLPNNGTIYAGVLIDNLLFVDQIVGPHFNSITEDEFIFAVQKKGDPNLFYYSSEEPPEGPFEKSQSLWVLSDLELKIKMSGATLQHLATERTRNNMILLIVVNVVFITGLVYVVRNVSREMELAKIKSNLVANVSHEIRTPVALIRMYTETLEMGRLTDEDKKKKYYKTMLAETVRLTQLINNMLDFSKIESKKKEYHMSANDLNVIVHQVLEMYQYNFEQKGFNVSLNNSTPLPFVHIDSAAVTQALVNLLDNAMKYSLDNKDIIISLYQEGNRVILSVQDHGIGIPEAEHKKIFQKFYRVGDSLVHNTKGSGLGLSLVDHIMRVHNGSVRLKSKMGEGSTFSLVFPIYLNSGA